MAAHPVLRDLAGAFQAIAGALAAHERHAEGLQPPEKLFVKPSDLELHQGMLILPELSCDHLLLLTGKRLEAKRGAVRRAAAMPYDDTCRVLFASEFRLADSRCGRVPLPASYGVVSQVRDETAGKAPPEKIIRSALFRGALPAALRGIGLIIFAELLPVRLLQRGPRAEPELLPDVKAAPDEHERGILIKKSGLLQDEGAALLVPDNDIITALQVLAVPSADEADAPVFREPHEAPVKIAEPQGLCEARAIPEEHQDLLPFPVVQIIKGESKALQPS